MLETNFTKLSYIPAEINIQPVFALVDSGATHNFVKEEVAKRLNLHIDLGVNMFKAVNSEVERVVGLVCQVPLNIGEWLGVINLIVIPLDDFGVVIG